MSGDEDQMDRPLVSKELVKEVLQEILNDIPAFRSLTAQSSTVTPKDGGSARISGHRDPPTRSDSGTGDTTPPQRTVGILAMFQTRSRALAGLKTVTKPNQEQQFSLVTPLWWLIPDILQTKSAVLVGPASPPIPLKLVEKIRRGDYIELHELLRARLGAPGPTILDALLQSDKIKQKKGISCIDDWVLCFNTLVSVTAMHTPEQANDLLA